jgi:hypothetical protein
MIGLNSIKSLEWRRSKLGREPGRRRLKRGIRTRLTSLLKPIRGKRKTIAYLEQDRITFCENKEMTDHAMNFYKKLFGEEQSSNIKLGEGFWEDGEKITSEENEI